MAGIVYHVDIDDRAVQAMFQRVIAFGQCPVGLMKDIAVDGQESTIARFRDQAGPDGQAWRPSLRVQARGGKTLIKDRHLMDSIVSNAGGDFAEWGANVPYAAIHQFGGVIRAKNKSYLFFKLADGSGRRVKEVTIPARPYIGINAADEASILKIINRHLAAAVGGL